MRTVRKIFSGICSHRGTNKDTGDIMIRTEESQEMYLKTIYILKKSGLNICSMDIATELGYAKSSVSVAMKGLRNNGYIVMNDNQIVLTSKGYQKARKIYDRFTVFTQILEDLGVERKQAEETACRMEHVVSDEVFEVIKKKVFDKTLFSAGKD